MMCIIIYRGAKISSLRFVFRIFMIILACLFFQMDFRVNLLNSRVGEGEVFVIAFIWIKLIS